MKCIACRRNSFPAGLFIIIFGIKMHCTICFGFRKNFPGIWVWSRWFSEYVYLYWRIVMHFESIGNKGIHFQIKWLHFRYSFYKIENEIVFFKFNEKVIKPKVFYLNRPGKYLRLWTTEVDARENALWHELGTLRLVPVGCNLSEYHSNSLRFSNTNLDSGWDLNIYYFDFNDRISQKT